MYGIEVEHRFEWTVVYVVDVMTVMPSFSALIDRELLINHNSLFFKGTMF